METKTKSGFIGQLWSGWVNLDPAQRNHIVEKLGPLGPVGHCLSIAANCQNFVVSAQVQAQDGSKPPEEDDIIDVDFKEV